MLLAYIVTLYHTMVSISCWTKNQYFFPDLVVCWGTAWRSVNHHNMDTAMWAAFNITFFLDIILKYLHRDFTMLSLSQLYQLSVNLLMDWSTSCWTLTLMMGLTWCTKPSSCLPRPHPLWPHPLRWLYFLTVGPTPSTRQSFTPGPLAWWRSALLCSWVRLNPSAYATCTWDERAFEPTTPSSQG